MNREEIQQAILDIDPNLTADVFSSIPWTDNYFIENFVDPFSKFGRPDRNRAVTAASNFLNFYLTSDLRGQNYQIICLTLWSYTKVNGMYLTHSKFHDDTTTSDIESLSTAEKIESVNPVFSISRGHMTTSGDTVTATFTKLNGELVSITKDQVREWYNVLWGNLHPASHNDTSLKAATDMLTDNTIYYLTFISLKLLRLIAKDQKSVEQNIATTISPQFEQFWSFNININFTVPPHADFQLNVGAYLRRFNPLCTPMLVVVVYSALFSDIIQRENLLGIFNAACLQSLSFLGLGCINWLYQASKTLKCTPGNLLRYFDFDMLTHSVYKIEKWIYDVSVKETIITKVYARLFRDGAFPEISTRNQPIITLACAAIVHSTDPSHHIWSIAQFQLIKRNDIDFTVALQLADAIKKLFTEQMTTRPQSEQARRVADILKSLTNLSTQPSNQPGFTIF